VPTQAILKNLTSPAGTTDFNPPLNMAKGLIDKYEKSFDTFVLVMMSDGGASYPSEGVENIKKSVGKGKIAFKSIAFGEGSDN
jgi:hypothetical protein